MKQLLFRFLIGVLCVYCCSFFACQPVDEMPTANDRLLAQVFNKSLFQSELEGMVPSNSSLGDSALIVNSYIEKWVRESLLMHEAERNIPKDLNIDELVRDYRASLIRHNYEKLLVELQLDSTITVEALKKYYEENQLQFQLDYPVLRCFLIKVPQTAPDIDQLEEWWKEKGEETYYTNIVDYCSKHADVYILNDSIWYKFDDIALQLPEGKLTKNNLSNKKEMTFSNDEFKYFVHIHETVAEKEIAPLSYARNQISKVILHKRKIKLLEEKKEEMYDRETRRNNIKIFD